MRCSALINKPDNPKIATYIFAIIRLMSERVTSVTPIMQFSVAVTFDVIATLRFLKLNYLYINYFSNIILSIIIAMI
ncbi:hypothetical protein IGI42_003341 [Enterococcus sp. AZ109]